MHIKRGEKIALFVWLVLTMIKRFYDLDQGSLRVEGQDIRLLNLPVLSSTIGVVSRKPLLFNRSTADNIEYGDKQTHPEPYQIDCLQ